jgi:hypothetical protein
MVGHDSLHIKPLTFRHQYVKKKNFAFEYLNNAVDITAAL